MSISARIGLVSIVLWIVSIWLTSGNESLGLYLMVAALFLTVLAVFWPDWPSSKFNVTPTDIAKTIKDPFKSESRHEKNDSNNNEEDMQ